MIKHSGSFKVIPIGGRHYQLFLFTGTTNNPRGFQSAGLHVTGLDSHSAEQPQLSPWMMVGGGEELNMAETVPPFQGENTLIMLYCSQRAAGRHGGSKQTPTWTNRDGGGEGVRSFYTTPQNKDRYTDGSL